MVINESFLKSFLIKNKINNPDFEKIDSDASFRKYFRIKNKNLLIMYAPKNRGESLESFKKINEILSSLNLSVSKIYDVDYQANLMLLEDFGDNIFSKKLNSKNEKYFYEEAVRLLSYIVNNSNSETIQLKPYSFEVLLNESYLFIEWYIKKHLCLNVDDFIKEEFSKILREIFNSLNIQQSTLVLRDFHVDNLFYLEKRAGLNQIGLIDYQDALLGSRVYDLTSLIEDVRRPITMDLKISLIKQFSKSIAVEMNKLENEISFYSIQRNLKIIGIFSRLKYRDNKENYIPLIKNSWNFINQHLEKPQYTKLKKWMDNILREKK